MRTRFKFNRPEYWAQPVRGLKRIFKIPRGVILCRTAWGVEMEINTLDSIGVSIYKTGVYDLALTEILWRLIKPGDFVIDVGANIGYTCGICSLRAGKEGSIYAFEPNPLVHPRLKTNISKLRENNITLFPFGLSEHKQMSKLVLPGGYQNNEGLAYVDESSKGNFIEVPLERLDDIVPIDKSINLMKIDVEGHELSVLKGSTALLEQKRIKTIIFEDHNKYPTQVSQMLESYGYKIGRIEKGWTKLLLKDPLSPSKVSFYEPTNYIASFDFNLISDELKSRGYKCLRA